MEMEMEKLQKKLKKYRGLRKNFIDLIEGFSSSSDSSDTDSSSEAEMEAAPKEWEDDLSDSESAEQDGTEPLRSPAAQLHRWGPAAGKHTVQWHEFQVLML